MAIDPADRYESAEALATDLRAALDGRPLVAERGRRWHRSRAFVRRHRGRLTVGGVAVILLVGATAMVIEQRWDRDRAQNAAEARLAAMTWLYEELLPEMDREETAEQRVEIAAVADRLEWLIAEDPLLLRTLEPGLSLRLCKVHRETGRLDRAEKASLRVIVHLGGVEALRGPLGFDVLHHHAGLLHEQGRHDDALQPAEELVRLAERDLGVECGEAYDARELVASILFGLDRAEEAHRIHERHWNDVVARRAAGRDFQNWPTWRNAVWAWAGVLVERGDRVAAEAIMREQIETHVLYQPLGPGRLNCLRIFADTLELWGELEEALALQREVLAGRVSLYGEHGHRTCESSRKRVARLEEKLGLTPGGSVASTVAD